LQRGFETVIFLTMTRCLALSIPLLWAASAFAAERPIIAVVGFHAASVHGDDAEALSEALTEAIERSKRATPIAGDRVGATIAGRQPVILEEALLARGRTLLAEGRNLYNQAQPDAAVPILEDAIAALEDGVVVAGEMRDLWDARLVLGTSELARGNREAAARAFRDAIALNPGRSPDPALYPPDVTGLYEEVRAESASGTASLQLTAPASMDVWVDGMPSGKTPATVADLMPGVHYVRARSDGRMATARIKVEPGSEAVVRLEPVEPTLGTAATSEARQAREIGRLYRAVGRHMEGVDYALVAGANDTEVLVQLYDVQAEAFSQPTRVPYSGDPGDEATTALTLVLGVLDDAGDLPAERSQPSAVALDRGANPVLASLLLEPIDPVSVRPRRRNTALWVGLGIASGVVVAATATTVGLAATSGPRNKGTVIVLPF
jgi:tetratricopeptide (TPR) repeat protein